MLTDQEFVVSSFEKNFSNCKERAIVLYGKGPFTQLLLERFKSYNIVGIMDRDVKNGYLYEKKVLSFSDALEQKIDMIVVVSRPNSIQPIFERIRKFCSVNHIQLYGISGKNLFEVFDCKQEADTDVVHTFAKNFSAFKNKKIVLYGKGSRTKAIVEAFGDYNIIGLMDKNVKDGWCFGKRILSFDEIIAHKPDIIISVTRPWTTPHVYKRIGQLCAYNHILLYDINNENLFETMGELKEEIEVDPYFEVSEEALKTQIRTHSIISFDVFDTLIMRKTLLPVDVFEIVGDRAKNKGICIRNYKTMRRKAEKSVTQSNSNIYDIYKNLQVLTGITNDERDWLLQKELDIEKQVLIRREKMVDLLEFAIKEEKRVFLISDMYLPEDILNSILSNLNIVGYEKLYVSCDFNAGKGTGLFDLFKRQIRGDSYLHIGDNQGADVDSARRYGIDAFYIKKAHDMLDISSYAPIRSYLKTVNERSMVGLFISKVFNNPFSLYHTGGRADIDQIYDVGYLFVAPLVTDFVIWLVEEMKKSSYDDILFAARDGYLIQRLYEIYKKVKNLQSVPKGIYFQTSRMVVTNAAMQTEDDIKWLFSLPCALAPEQFLKERFKIPEEKMIPYDEVQYPDAVSYGIANQETICERSKEIRTNYMKYIEQVGIQPNKKYAFVDLVSSGTCQYFINKTKLFYLENFYLCYHSGGTERDMLMNHERFYEGDRTNNSYMSYIKTNNIFSNYCFLETVLSSELPSLVDIDNNGMPILGVEPRTPEELQFVREMHQAIEDYFNEYINDLYMEDIVIGKIVADKLFCFKNIPYTYEHCKQLDDFSLFEDLMQNRVALVRQ